MLNLASLAVVASMAIGQAEEKSANYQHLKPLESLIGQWVFEGPVQEDSPLLKKGTVIRVVNEYKWGLNKNVVVMNGSAEVAGKRVLEVLEVISWSPKSENVVIGSFQSTGSSSHGKWNINGDMLTVKFRGHEADGTEVTSTNIVTIVGKDRLTWQSTARTRNGKEEPDTAVYELQRISSAD